MPEKKTTARPKPQADPVADLEAVARAFGFHSTAHMEAVITGRAPSALESPAYWSKKQRRAS